MEIAHGVSLNMLVDLICCSLPVLTRESHLERGARIGERDRGPLWNLEGQEHTFFFMFPLHLEE